MAGGHIAGPRGAPRRAREVDRGRQAREGEGVRERRRFVSLPPRKYKRPPLPYWMRGAQVPRQGPEARSASAGKEGWRGVCGEEGRKTGSPEGDGAPRRAGAPSGRLKQMRSLDLFLPLSCKKGDGRSHLTASSEEPKSRAEGMGPRLYRRREIRPLSCRQERNARKRTGIATSGATAEIQTKARQHLIHKGA